MRKLFTCTVIGLALLATPVMAQTYDDGAKAYNKRDYNTAIKNWEPLAEKATLKRSTMSACCTRKALVSTRATRKR